MNTRCAICSQYIPEGQNKFPFTTMVNTHKVCWDETYLCPNCGADGPDGVMFSCDCVLPSVGTGTITGQSRW